jgi:putative peptidoglycan lipid II flippase
MRAGTADERVLRATGAAADTAAGGVWTAVSRATGLLRVLAVGAVLGPTAFGNTFQFTNTLPNVVYYGFLAGSLVSSLLVPGLVRRLTASGRWQDPVAAGRLAGGFLGAVLVGLVLLAPLALLGAPVLVRLTGEPGQAAVARVLLLLTVPQVFGYAVVGTCVAVMTARRRFALAAAAPAVENIGTVAVLLGVAALPGDASHGLPSGQLVLLGAGCTAAVGLHACLQWVGARRAGVLVRPRAGWRDPEVRAVLSRGCASIAQAGLVGVQLLAMSVLANRVAGGVVAYQVALNFFFLPIAVFATPAALALLPRASDPAVVGDRAASRDVLVRAVSSAQLFVLPAAVGYLVLADPLARSVAVGRLGSDYGTALLSRSLAAVACGLLGYAVFQVATYARYAQEDTRSPLRSMVVQTTTSCALLVVATRVHGTAVVTSVGMAFAAACTVSAGHLLRTAYRRTAPGVERLGPGFLRSATAGLVMAVLVRAATALVPGAGRAGALLDVGVGLLVGVGTYLGVLALLGSPELAAFGAGVRRLRRVAPEPVP